jgi:superfamily I DNA and/or RNA helicase
MVFEKEINNHPLFQDLENDRFDIIVYEDPTMINDNIEDIFSYKAKSFKNVVTIGESLGYTSTTATFNIPDDINKLPVQGILLLSDKNTVVEQRRRQKVVYELNSRTNPTANMIMRLTAGEEDSQTGGNIEPLTAAVLEKMFGDKKFKVTENYREAMYIAINTPDLALIQGPPGTGKTTLIKGIVARLNSMENKNYKILVSSEQHEALFNVVEKLSSNKLIPPFILSKLYEEKGAEEDNGKFKSNVINFQREFIKYCNELLKDQINGVSGSSNVLSDIIYSICKIRSDNYSISSIKENLSAVNASFTKYNFGDKTQGIITKIFEEISIQDMNNNDNIPPTREAKLYKAIESQRLTIESYLDDGSYKLSELQRLLKKEPGLANFEIDATLMEKMQSGDTEVISSVFDEHIKYVEKTRENILPKQTNEFEKQKVSFKALFDELLTAIQDYSKNHKKDFYDIVEELKYKLLDTDNVVAAIKRYTNIIGSTCAQAHKSIDKTELTSAARYDYVIIDEASRANPLDIMIPVMLGTRVILVGDQMQLPHFIETKEAREFAENPKQKQQYNYDGKLLEKPLFGLIYERVEKSWNEQKLKFKRHIRINEQHRMHPVIGDFISRTFYERAITNGAKTTDNTNTYSVFDGKNIAWLNIPITDGLEEGKPSYYRMPEVKQVIDVLKEILSNLNAQEPKIGIISFYKKQTEIISKEIKESNFPEDYVNLIECNTVDSFQGKEFDIVILSTVRSNVAQTAGESLGFIHYSKSRINVAFSRAKRLLIVVGDANTFAKNDFFAGYIKYVKESGYYA